MSSAATGLFKDSVADVSGIVSTDRQSLTERVGELSAPQPDRILAGIDLVLGRP